MREAITLGLFLLVLAVAMPVGVLIDLIERRRDD